MKEYKIVQSDKGRTAQELEDLLNALAIYGWKVIWVSDSWTVFLERDLKEMIDKLK